MSNNQSNATAPREKVSFAKAALDYMEMFVVAAAVVILLLTFGCRLCVVSGDSMKNTLFQGEKLLVSDLFYTPERGDIIVLHQTGGERYNEPIVKRVIATGGQFVRIDYMEAKVYVSDDDTFTEEEIIDESGYIFLQSGHWREAASLTPAEDFAVPEGHLFVMGDNRNVSADSRTDEIGMVDERRVLGKVLFRVAPFTAFH